MSRHINLLSGRILSLARLSTYGSSSGASATAYPCRRHQSTITRRPSCSFAFDIDGVLLRSSKPIPGAIDALQLLKKYDVPFILLTNGGGLSEQVRTQNLSRHLDMEISTEQFIQSHTPFRLHCAQKKYKNVLVSGGVLDTCRYVAKDYGFAEVTIPFDILATDPAVWPYHTLTSEEKACTSPLSSTPIDAIYVFHDPRDWGLDSQVIIDVLVSQNGQIGTRQHKHFSQTVPIYFSNPDLLWANAHPHVRFGQGAFQILVEGLYEAVTGQKLVSTTIGKPSQTTYEYASKVLAEYQRQANRNGTCSEIARKGNVYMVGDNPMSDIQGANDFGWTSMLVKTGVFRGTREEGTTGPIPAHHCVENVLEAVETALRIEKII